MALSDRVLCKSIPLWPKDFKLLDKEYRQGRPSAYHNNSLDVCESLGRAVLLRKTKILDKVFSKSMNYVILRNVEDKEDALVCQGCHNTTPQTGQLTQWNLSSHSSGG
jgi:hypothetical protein